MNEFIIETRHLTKQYGTQKSVADLNIHVRKGRIYGLLGRNGAGKTTTMKMLLGLTPPSAGEVILWGKALRGNEKKVLPRIGSMIESPGFYPNLTGTENLHIFATLRGIPKASAIQDALMFVGLPYRDKKLFSQYSLGMKQRLALALAVMHDPELLILDEPINGLDPIGIAEVRTFIRDLSGKKGKTILLSSHILSEIALLADDIGIIDQGVLLEEESFEEKRETSPLPALPASACPPAAPSPSASSEEEGKEAPLPKEGEDVPPSKEGEDALHLEEGEALAPSGEGESAPLSGGSEEGGRASEEEE